MPKRKKPARKSTAIVHVPRATIPPGDQEEAAPKKNGRPTDYSVEIAKKICDRMVNGESLRSICRDEEMPGLTTVFDWKTTHQEFRERYAHAREMQAEVLAEEIIEIADSPMIGVRKKITPRGPELIEGDMVERSRLMVDARKWAAARILPKKYGDSSRLSREDGQNPLKEIVAEFRKAHEDITNGQT